METAPLHGRPGTKQLPLTEGRAGGGPIALGLGSYVAVALAGGSQPRSRCWPPRPSSRPPTRSRLCSGTTSGIRGRPQVALPLSAGGFLRAPGLAFDFPALVWSGAILTDAGLALVLAELLGLVRRAPGNRTLVVSRTGVALSCFHVAAALVLGAFVFSHGDASVAGISHAAVGARAPAARGLRLADRAELWTLLPES